MKKSEKLCFSVPNVGSRKSIHGKIDLKKFRVYGSKSCRCACSCTDGY